MLSVLKRRKAGATALAAAVAFTGFSAVGAAAPADAQTTSGAVAQTDGQANGQGKNGPDHVFVIMMENHGYDQVIGNTADAPYINTLA